MREAIYRLSPGRAQDSTDEGAGREAPLESDDLAAEEADLPAASAEELKVKLERVGAGSSIERDHRFGSPRAALGTIMRETILRVPLWWNTA